MKTPVLPLPHMRSLEVGLDSAWDSRHQARSPHRDAVSPKWAVAGPQRKMASRRSKAPQESPVGFQPLRLEERFNALDVNSEPEMHVDFRNGVNSPVVGEGAQHASHEVANTDGEFSDKSMDNSASWSIGDRPVDASWPVGSLVKWKDPNHPGYFEYDYAIVSNLSSVEEEVKRDDRPWREGKITVYTGDTHVWASLEELILLPPGSFIPRELTNGAASPSPAPEPLLNAHDGLWDWMGGMGLLEAGCLELPVPQSRLPHLIGKRGRFIRHLENKLGVILGVMDSPGDSVVVSVVGPIGRLEMARKVVEIASKGARSFLDHLHWPPPPG